jgi:hypothetical protein
MCYNKANLGAGASSSETRCQSGAKPLRETPMSQKSRYSVRMHAALCAAFGLAVLVGSVGAAGAEDDADNANGNWVRNLYRKLNARAGAPISNGEYERPPLVVPPTRELAPPGTPSTLQRSASWPVDRDEARRKAGGTTVRANAVRSRSRTRARSRPLRWRTRQSPSSANPAPPRSSGIDSLVAGTRRWGYFQPSHLACHWLIRPKAIERRRPPNPMGSVTPILSLRWGAHH